MRPCDTSSVFKTPFCAVCTRRLLWLHVDSMLECPSSIRLRTNFCHHGLDVAHDQRDARADWNPRSALQQLFTGTTAWHTIGVLGTNCNSWLRYIMLGFAGQPTVSSSRRATQMGSKSGTHAPAQRVGHSHTVLEHVLGSVDGLTVALESCLLHVRRASLLGLFRMGVSRQFTLSVDEGDGFL